MKIWITKYALTKGIIEADTETDLSLYRKVKIGNNKGKSMYFPENRNLKLPYSAINPNDYFDTKEKAIKKAEQMRKEKISKLKNQIEQLENMKFD